MNQSAAAQSGRLDEITAAATEYAAGLITLEEYGKRTNASLGVPEDGWDAVSGVVLYDMFYETGTRLGGALVALERRARRYADDAQAQRWLDEDLAMLKDRTAVGADDRSQQILMMLRWGARVRTLSEFPRS